LEGESDLKKDTLGQFTDASERLKQLLKFRNLSLPVLRQRYGKHCQKCDDVKPAKSHHCSICDDCVFMMDHHCPWVDNCVALHNLRYFLGFIFHMLVGCWWYLLGCLCSFLDPESYSEKIGIILLQCVMSGVLGFVMICFNGWNWYLAIMGHTAIDFWQAKKNPQLPSEEEKRRRKEDCLYWVRDNLYVIFGTRSFFKVLLPSCRALPLRGLEWSFEQIESDPEAAIEVTPEDRDLELAEMSFDLIQESNRTSEKRPMLRAEDSTAE
jgi:hypothetical protein